MKYPDDFINKVICGDCLDVMKHIPDGSVDLVVTDPPFTFGLGSSITNTKLDNWSDLLNGSHFFKEIFNEIKRICRLNAGIWISNSWRSLPCIIKALCESNLKIESVLVWNKDWIGPGGCKGLRPSYEVVAFISLGDFGLPNRGLRDIQTFQWSSHKPHHPAEKPLSLIRWIVEQSGNIDLVLDPFLGSGTTAVACKQLGCRFIGIEINPEYCKIAEDRLRQEELF